MRTIRLLGTFLFLLVGSVSADDQLRIVTTLPTYAVITKAIAGEHASVSAVASARFNPHFIEPKPSDVLRLKRADLFIHSGLDLEAWRDPLVDAAGRADLRAGGERQLDLSARISLLEVPTGTVSRAEGDIHVQGNPHYWLDPRNGEIIAEEISEKLSQLDPKNAEGYQRNLSAFRSGMQQKLAGWQALFAPFKGSEVVGYHNEWVYFMNFVGLKMRHFLEPKPGIPPSPQQLDFLTHYIREHHIPAVVQSTYFPTEAGQTLAERSGAKLVLLAQSTGEVSGTEDYLQLIDYNCRTLAAALKR